MPTEVALLGPAGLAREVHLWDLAALAALVGLAVVVRP
jgi:hypothetical protein